MRTITRLPASRSGPVARTPRRDELLERYLKTDVEDYISGFSGVYVRYQNYLRMYRGTPTDAFSRDPIPVRNIEITIGATAVDTLFSQSWDMIFSQSPIVTVRGNSKYEKHAVAFQELTNHLAIDPFTNYIPATKDFMMDDIMLGTGSYYTMWQEDLKKTQLEEIVEWGPRVYAPAPEDLVVPSGSAADIQTVRTLGFGNEMTEGEFKQRGKQEGWDFEIAAPTRQGNPVRRSRLISEHVTDTDHAMLEKFQIYELYVMFDYDEDGFDEDLYIVWDRTSARVLYLSYNPFDNRPFTVSRYQYQPHSFLGLGVMEMIAPYETEVSDWHNFRMANAKLVGSRAWGVRAGSPMSGTKLRIVPNKPLYFNDPTDIKEFRMADIYPSALQTEQYSSQLAQQRVGTMTDFQSKPMPGHRTAGITMMAVLQQINKRFTTAFEEMRGGMADALIQCIYRMHEQYRTKGPNKARIEDMLTGLLGAQKAELIAEIFREPPRDLVNKLKIEMTASSQSINREGDKQSAVQRLQVLGQYYQQVLQLATVVANPQTPPAIKEMAIQVAKRGTNAMAQFLHTFESVRNADALMIDEETWDALIQSMQGGGQQNAMGQQAGGQGGPGGLPGGPGGSAAGGAPGNGGSQDMGAAPDDQGALGGTEVPSNAGAA